MPDGTARGLYVYGVVSSTDTEQGNDLPGGVQGMDGHPVELVRGKRLGALVTEIVLPRPPGRRRDLVSHSEVLNTLALERDVVPLRFGTVFPHSDAVLDELLTARVDELTALLERVGDAVQLNFRAAYVEERVLAEIVQASREIRRLRERTQQLPPGTSHPDVLRLGRLVADAVDRRRREDSALLTESVLPLAREIRARERSSTDHVLDLALLVERDAVQVVEDHLEEVAADVHERIRLELTGPLAPFDFLEEESWA